MTLSGKSFIGWSPGAAGKDTFQASNPATGKSLDPPFHSASLEELDVAAQLADQAFSVYRLQSGAQKALFLRSIAAKIEAAAERIIERAQEETALPKARLQNETARTCNQFRLFASVLAEGSWIAARIDHADPARKPTPKPDVRSMSLPLGPVAVFGASNFPMAYSVAGGDTASALAAGNPVIVKAHPAHPGTSELTAQAVRESVRECHLPEGVFSLLFDSGTSIGAALVQHPLIKAAGFTGSQSAGRALFNLAAARREPIPFYGEMGSTNPLFILPGALEARGKEIASDLFGSFTLGAGQFCTKPGLVFVAQAQSETFLGTLKEKVSAAPKGVLLTAGIRSAYDKEVLRRARHANLNLLAQGEIADSNAPFFASPSIFQTDVADFQKSPELAHELFGPSTLVIRYQTREQILQCARELFGHLTATIHGSPQDLLDFSDLVHILENKAGRLIFNGYPTGVEVNHAIVHGGPYPASTDSRTTSVGAQAIFRFVRPVCYQDFPDAALPPELQNANPLRIWRTLDSIWTRDPA
ncbi:MAG: aldehyde dehydrogenase (NADP(+)) [Candidatus Acidiferrum sp.]